MSDIKSARNQCRDFAKLHLKECCAELIEWQDTAILRDGRMRELAKLCNQWVDNHDGLRVAESFINRAAIDLVAAPDSARDAARLDWLIANPHWSVRWRFNAKKKAEQWQMVDDGDSWGQWGGYRAVIDAAMATAASSGAKGA